jgi:hypothetical protein
MSHPVAFVLERLAVDDLPPDEAAATRAHVEECAQCRGYVESLAAMSARRLAAVPPAIFAERVAARRRSWVRRWLGAGPLATAGALVAASLALWTRPPAMRVKGGGGFVVERRRDGVVTRLGSDARVRAGDELRVVVALPAPTTVAAWVVDAAVRVDALLDAPLAVGAGEQALPGSVHIDAPCVDGWLVVATGDAATRAPPSGASAGGLRARLTCE